MNDFGWCGEEVISFSFFFCFFLVLFCFWVRKMFAKCLPYDRRKSQLDGVSYFLYFVNSAKSNSGKNTGQNMESLGGSAVWLSRAFSTPFPLTSAGGGDRFRLVMICGFSWRQQPRTSAFSFIRRSTGRRLLSEHWMLGMRGIHRETAGCLSPVS